LIKCHSDSAFACV